MKVRHKGPLQVAGFQLRDASVKNSGLGSTHNAGSEIDKIGTIANHDGGRRTGTVRIRHRCAGAKEYHLVRLGRSFGAWLFGSCGLASIANNIRKDSNTERVSFMESSIRLTW